MPLFDYAGQLQTGSMFQGTLEADSKSHAETMLTDMGVRATTLRPARRSGYLTPLSLDDFLFFNEQIAAMTKAGVALEEGLRQLAADVGSRKLKRLLVELADDLAAGTPLEQAIAKQQRRFPTQYASVVQAGLKTGDLGGTLYGLAAHLRIKSGVRRALIELGAYPFVILLFAGLVVSFLMRVVMPEVESVMYDVLGYPNRSQSIVSLAPVVPTRIPSSLELAQFVFLVAHNWAYVEIVLAVILLAVPLAFAATLMPGGGAIRELWLRNIPGIAQVYRSSLLARFAHTSALAAYSGTPLPQLISSAGAASGSPRLAAASMRVAGRINSGDSLETAATNEREFPALWTCIVSATAPRGDLPAALQELAQTYENRAEHWIGIMRALLGPLLLLLVAGALGAVVVSMLSVFVSIIRALGA